jgi:uncharacterized protein (TIGR03083 family)
MNALATQFLTNVHRFSRTVESGIDWSAQSSCSDWTAAQVLDHVVDTQRDFAAQHGRPLGDRPTGSPAEIWAGHWSAMAPVAADNVLMSTSYDGWFGPTTIGETLWTFYGFDLVVHAWDIASPSGVADDWSDSELDQVEQAIASFGPALYMEGICAPAVDAPAGAPRQVRLLGLLGRSAAIVSR